jgi:transglutaminase superfamily protein
VATKGKFKKDSEKMPKLSLKRLILYMAAACFCIALFWAITRKNEDIPHRFPAPNYSIHRQIRYSFTLQNTTNQLLKNAEFWTYAPVKQTPTQRCVGLETSHPYELILDDIGNQILYFRFDTIPPYSTKIITIKADLELSNTPNQIIVPDLQPFLRSEKYVESDDPKLSEFAGRFKDSEQVKTAENIFRWVAGNVKYTGYVGNDRGALYGFNHKKGDCTEYMYLFAAFSRANKIPARCIGGYICRENTILKPSAYHNWAEIYEDHTWRNVDPQNKVFMQSQSDYIAMRIIGNTKSGRNPMGDYQRFRFSGDGLKVKMNR